MKPQVHSKIFAPSKSMIWLQCCLSTVFNDGNNDESSEVAEFGSECHELGSIQISNALGVSDYEGDIKSAAEAIKSFKHYDENMQEIADKDKFAGCCTYNSRIKLSNREFNCEYCEVSIDRYFNAATNLYNYLIEKIGRVTAEFTLANLTALENDLNVNDLATSKVETRNQYNFYSYL